MQLADIRTLPPSRNRSTVRSLRSWALGRGSCFLLPFSFPFSGRLRARQRAGGGRYEGCAQHVSVIRQVSCEPEHHVARRGTNSNSYSNLTHRGEGMEKAKPQLHTAHSAETSPSFGAAPQINRARKKNRGHARQKGSTPQAPPPPGPSTTTTTLLACCRFGVIPELAF
jgi:hypothetical protein